MIRILGLAICLAVAAAGCTTPGPQPASCRRHRPRLVAPTPSNSPELE